LEHSGFDEPIVEAFIYETSQILEMLEQVVMSSEKSNRFSEESINEIFRFMHTIKGSSAMMMFNNMSTLAHKIEDVFYVIRENSEVQYDFSLLIDLVLESIDFFKDEMFKIKNSEPVDGDDEALTAKFIQYLEHIKSNNEAQIKVSQPCQKPSNEQKYYIRSSGKANDTEKYRATVFFEQDCEMENIRAYTIIHNIVELVEEMYYTPSDIIDNDQTVDIIRKKGFKMVIKSQQKSEVIKSFLENTIFLEKLEFEQINQQVYDELALQYSQTIAKEEIKIPESSKKYQLSSKMHQEATASANQNIISVNVEKLDKLMDMVGELVITEAMVTQNPEITCFEVESFEKSSRQLHKITAELQDMVMSIRMIPLATTFMKMHRIVRDMNKKLEKNVVLEVIGEETEVDKNIIEKISDPLMHIIRNAIDHGIEDKTTRINKGKTAEGVITLEAKNSGSDVLVIIGDDGRGLNREAIYNKAKKQGLVHRNLEEMSDSEIFNIILAPGFSTNDQVTEFSGRGVGMDVVCRNIESIGGTILIDSQEDEGTTITLKIPLTLAIIEGMNIKVGQSRFTIPIVAIQESFRAKSKAIIQDNEGNEMIMVRGLCYPILRLHQFYSIETDITAFEQGILIMVEEDGKSCCVFADELLGQQQVVVKSLPEYIKKYKKIKGLAGCTLLGDGSISLILDVRQLNLTNVKLLK
jgi:two-component system chemotaxis sensor kinase CheA